MHQDSLKYRNKTFEGMTQMSYTIHSIQRRAFYTYIHANLDGIRSHLLTSNSSDHATSQFLSVLSSFNLIQHRPVTRGFLGVLKNPPKAQKSYICHYLISRVNTKFH